MPYKIVIDPGHGGSDFGATYNGRTEKEDNLNLALAVGQILENNGIDVVYTRTSDVYNTPFEKATMANNAGADFFVSIHRNSLPTPNSGSGVETLVFNDSGTKAEMARNINSELAKLGFNNRGVIERPNLVVLKRTKKPALLVEAGFINNDADNAKFDSEFGDIAAAIASGILETLDMGQLQQMPLYKVQVGAFDNIDSASNLSSKLNSEGYPSYIVEENNLYKVMVGAFSVLQNAVNTETRLRDDGYSTFITT